MTSTELDSIVNELVQDQRDMELASFRREVFAKVSGFYETPERAEKVLHASHLGKKEVTRAELERFHRTERKLFHKRLAKGIRCKVELLEIALDESPVHRPESGFSLGWPAYEAEAFYKGPPLHAPSWAWR